MGDNKMSHEEHKANSDPSLGYDREEASIGMILLVGGAIVALVAVMIIALTQFFDFSKDEAVYEMTLRPESVDLRELRARETEVLNSYKLLDSAKGIWQIPIDRAMHLVADEAFRADNK